MAEEQKQAPKPHARPQQKPAPLPAKALKSTAKEGVKGIIRLAGKEVDGGLAIKSVLKKVKGIGSTLSVSLSKIIQEQLKLDVTTPVGALTDEQLEQVETVMRSPQKYGVLPYLLNRQKSGEMGSATHLVMNDLIFAVRQDVQGEKDLRTWIGWRHSLGQKVRGQRNRTTGRSGMTVGVLKKALKSTKAAAATGAQEAAKEKK